MKGNFEKCLEIILHHEGGYVNHPRDPGGETNLGVTKRVYEEFGGTKDMKDLTVEDVTPIYRKNYWDRIKGDDLPSGIDLVVFDWGVNSGPSRAVKKLQEVVGSPADGGVGPNTLKAINAAVEEKGVVAIIESYKEARQTFYESLPTFDAFGRGWTRRNDETTATALEMV